MPLPMGQGWDPSETKKYLKQSKDILIGEFLFHTNDGNKALVYAYRGKGTFTLKRMMQNGRMEERSNIDVYEGNANGYASEATLRWGDLEREGVVWKPR